MRSGLVWRVADDPDADLTSDEDDSDCSSNGHRFAEHKQSNRLPDGHAQVLSIVAAKLTSLHSWPCVASKCSSLMGYSDQYTRHVQQLNCISFFLALQVAWTARLNQDLERSKRLPFDVEKAEGLRLVDRTVATGNIVASVSDPLGQVSS